MDDKNDSEYWQGIRSAFINTPTRPTFAELSQRFEIPEKTVARKAAEEGWALMRAKRIEQALSEGDAKDTILEAVGVNRSVTNTAAEVGLLLLLRIAEAMQKMQPELKASTDANLLQQLSFAFYNACKAMKEAGVLGLPKHLSQLSSGKEWSPHLVAAINLTIQGVAKAQPDRLLARAERASVELENTPSEPANAEPLPNPPPENHS